MLAACWRFGCLHVLVRLRFLPGESAQGKMDQRPHACTCYVKHEHRRPGCAPFGQAACPCEAVLARLIPGRAGSPTTLGFAPPPPPPSRWHFKLFQVAISWWRQCRVRWPHVRHRCCCTAQVRPAVFSHSSRACPPYLTCRFPCSAGSPSFRLALVKLPLCALGVFGHKGTPRQWL